MIEPVSRVLFIANHFPPLGGGGVQRAVKLVRYLPEFGHEPLVVTGSGGGFAFWTPEDATLGDDLPAGLDVRRVPGPEPQPSGGWRARAERVLGRDSAAMRWWIDGAVAVGRDTAAEVDVILGECVPYETAEVGARLARELRKPWVADLQDPWALDEMWQYATGLHRRRDLRRMRRLLATAAAIVMNTPEAVVRVRAAFPELREIPVVSIPNGFDAADFDGEVAARDDNVFRIVHSGYLHTELGFKHRRTRRLRRLLGGLPVPGVDYLTRSHIFLLEAVEQLLAARPGLRGRVEVHLAGVLTDIDRAVAEPYDFVRLHGYMAHAETVELVRTADLVFLPMHDLPPGVRAGLVPGKTYEYLASGRPILAAVPDGDARELLAEAGDARICRPSDVTAMAEAIGAEIDRRGAGLPSPERRADVVARYERRVQAGELAAVLDGVLDRTRELVPLNTV
jgi:glycosyltransferase involved in cell wall biosynthesis